jgi:hypothetical protein
VTMSEFFSLPFSFVVVVVLLLLLTIARNMNATSS